MKSTVSALWAFPDNRFTLPLNHERMRYIIADMETNGGALAPSDHWTFGEEHTSTMETMLSPWIGCTGLKRLDDKELHADTLADHLNYLKELNPAGLLGGKYVQSSLAQMNYRLADVQSLIDLALLGPYLDDGCDKKIRVVEVGGGFGRLAEALQLFYPGKIQHVLIDAVPASLMWAEVYLKSRFPQLNIVYADSNSFADVADADIVILPSWRSDILPENAFDLCVNIESFQEMAQVHVDYYYNYFNTRSKDDGLIYVTNSRDYVYKGPWNTPENWEQFFKHRTPRSWTRNHPVEIFRHRHGDKTASQRLCDFYYQLDLENFDSMYKHSAIAVATDSFHVRAIKKIKRIIKQRLAI